jgi:gluconokinase
MSRGKPLNDEDRGPWLRRIREEAVKASIGNPDSCEKGERPRGLVVACSALKKSYRDVLRGRYWSILTNSQGPDAAAVDGNNLPGSPHPHEPLHPSLPTFFVHLTGSYDTLYERMTNREGHYMKKDMLDSQIHTLEPPSDEEKSNDVTQVNIDATTDTNGQVEFALNGIVRLVRNRPLENHSAATVNPPDAQAVLPM